MSEGAVLDWSAAWLRGDLGASPSVAATAFAAFSAAMAVGRFGGDWLRHRWGAAVLVRASAAIAAIGLGSALLIATPLAAVVGFAGVGLGLSNTVPVLFGAAGRMPGAQPGAAIAATASVGYVGFLVGPPLIGLVAQLSTLGTALGLLVLACALVAAFARLVRIADARSA
jgi:MFS family permease